MCEDNAKIQAKIIFDNIKQDISNHNDNIFKSLIEKMEEIDKFNYNSEFSIGKIKEKVLNNNNKHQIYYESTNSNLSTNINTYNEYEEMSFENENDENNEDDKLNDIAYIIFDNVFLNINLGISSEKEICSFFQQLRKCFNS